MDIVNGQIAQSVEQRTENPCVGSSILPLATNMAALMESVSILIVEDNSFVQKMMRDLVLTKTCFVDLAATGSEALAKFKQKAYDLVLMDIQLPDLTGYEITKQIRLQEKQQQQRPVWIAGLTASIGENELQQAMAAGMNEIYAKPLSNQTINDILNKLIPVIDLDLGAKILGGTAEAAEKMIAELVKILPGDLEKIQAAFSARDYSALKNLAHYVHGGASFCGTPRLKAAASQLDKIIKPESTYQEIEQAYLALCKEITVIITEYHSRNLI